MSNSTELIPVILGLVLSWFVILGTRELIKEASLAVVRKTTS